MDQFNLSINYKILFYTKLKYKIFLIPKTTPSYSVYALNIPVAFDWGLVRPYISMKIEVLEGH